MIQLNIMKISKYGMLIFGLIFALAIAMLYFTPDGEEALVWLLQVGIIGVVGKYGFIASFFLWVLALFLNQKKET